MKSIILLIVGSLIASAQVPGCFYGTSHGRCYKFCEGEFATCPKGWKKEFEKVPGQVLGCYCWRPFTEDELKN